MPTYTWKNLETGEITENILKIAELDAYKANNPHLERYITSAPTMGDPVRLGRVKIDNGFREVLQKISSGAIGGSNLKDNIR
jgi:hypothetical protein